MDSGKFFRLLPFLGCLSVAHANSMDFDRAKLIDLTHPFDKNTIYWPTSHTHFEIKPLSRGKTEKGYFYSAFTICTPEHGGTHLDAPFHFSEVGDTVDQVPLHQVMGNAIVIDIRAKTVDNRDYRLSRSDVQQWENQFGKIPKGAIVLLRTGWSKFWPNAKEYLGHEKDVTQLHFPSFGEDAVTYLFTNAQIKAIGIDTASIDYGQSKDFPVHQFVAKNNIVGFENLSHLDELPEKGASIIALPMRISGGSGAPLRAVAILDAKGR